MPKKIILNSIAIEKRNYDKYFKKGISIAGAILMSLRDSGESFLEGIPNYYGSGPYKRLFKLGKYRKYRQNIKKKTLSANLCRLQKQGLIIKDPRQKIFALTENGKKTLLEFENRILIFQKPWDKKLRLVFFDIPEPKKIWREWLRKEIISMQFQKIQESVYVGKYPLPQSFYQEISNQGLDEYVFVITAGEIDKQNKILQVFNK